MKKLLIAIFATLSSVLSASADNIVVKDITMKKGATAAIDIELSNPDKTYTAFQLDLMLPEGISAATDSEGEYIIVNGSRLGSDHEITASPIEGGVRVVCVSLSSTAISGKSGSLFTIGVKADATIQGGKDYEATATGVVFTTTKDRDIEMDDADFTISIEGGVTPGDANGDSKVDIVDVAMTISHISGTTPAGFVKAAADMDGNCVVDKTDLAAIINLVLQK